MSYYLEQLEKKGITLKKEQAYFWTLPKQSQGARHNRNIAFDSDGRRICCVCKEPKDAEQFTVNRNRIDGRDARCKPCKSALLKRYRR